MRRGDTWRVGTVVCIAAGASGIKKKREEARRHRGEQTAGVWGQNLDGAAFEHKAVQLLHCSARRLV